MSSSPRTTRTTGRTSPATKRRCTLEQLEPRCVLASLWQNPGQALDVNDDLFVDKRDADLLMANTSLMNKPLPAATGMAPYFDVTGDGKFDFSDYFPVNNVALLKSPAVAARLQGVSNTGELTAQSIIAGRVSNWTNQLKLQGRVDYGNWVDLTANVTAGEFSLDPSALPMLAGEPIYAGEHLLELQLLRNNAKIGAGMDLPFAAASVDFPAPPDRSVIDDPLWTSNRPPGIVVNFQKASLKQFIGSPSIVRLPTGDYVATHDIFGSGSKSDTTRVFLSRDQGQTWVHAATLRGQFFSQLFVHDEQLYLFGTERVGGAVTIRRSLDGGQTWTAPASATTGKLLTGKFNTAPTPIVVHGGRVWRSMEAVTTGAWGFNFRPFVMSAPVDADLLRADSWTSSNRITPSATWLNG